MLVPRAWGLGGGAHLGGADQSRAGQPLRDQALHLPHGGDLAGTRQQASLAPNVTWALRPGRDRARVGEKGPVLSGEKVRLTLKSCPRPPAARTESSCAESERVSSPQSAGVGGGCFSLREWRKEMVLSSE